MKKRTISLVMSFLLLFSACSEQIISTVEYSNKKVLTNELIVNNASEEYLNSKAPREYKIQQEISLSKDATLYGNKIIFPFYKKEVNNKIKFYSIYSNKEVSNKEFSNNLQIIETDPFLKILDDNQLYIFDIYCNTIYTGEDGKFYKRNYGEYIKMKIGEKHIYFSYLANNEIKFYDSEEEAEKNKTSLTYGKYNYLEKLDLGPYGLKDYEIEGLAEADFRKYFTVYKKGKVDHTIFLKNDEMFMNIIGGKMIIAKNLASDLEMAYDPLDMPIGMYGTSEYTYYLIDIKTGKKNKIDLEDDPSNIFPLKGKDGNYDYYVWYYTEKDGDKRIYKEFIIDENFVVYDDVFESIDEDFLMFYRTSINEYATYLYKIDDNYLYNSHNSTIYNYNLEKIKTFENVMYSKYYPTNKVFRVTNKNNKVGLFDSRGNSLTGMEYNKIYSEGGRNGFFIAQDENFAYLLDTNTNEKTRLTYFFSITQDIYIYESSYDNKMYLSTSDSSFKLDITDYDGQFPYSLISAFNRSILYFMKRNKDTNDYIIIDAGEGDMWED